MAVVIRFACFRYVVMVIKDHMEIEIIASVRVMIDKCICFLLMSSNAVFNPSGHIETSEIDSDAPLLYAVRHSPVFLFHFFLPFVGLTWIAAGAHWPYQYGQNQGK